MTGWKHDCARCGKPVLVSESHVARAKLNAEGNVIRGEDFAVFHFLCAYPNLRAYEAENIG